MRACNMDININKKTSLTFELQLSGIKHNNLNGSLIVEIDQIEYGFPLTITSESASVDIPPFKNIIKRDIKNGEKFNVKLSLNGDGFYLRPWDGEFEVTSPIQVEAKVIKSKSPIKVKADILNENKKQTIKETPLISKINHATPIQKGIKSHEKVIEKPTRSFESLRDDILVRKDKPSAVDLSTKVKTGKAGEFDLKNVTEKQIYRVMEMLGTTNERVKLAIYEQCTIKAGTDDKAKILKEVIRFYKKKDDVSFKK
jgi:hypothetical protein